MSRRALQAATLALGAALMLTACGDEPSEEGGTPAVQTEEPIATPAANETHSATEEQAPDGTLPEGTPMEERVATLGLLNKRNNLTQDIVLKPGEERRVDDVLIRLKTCERRPPWDNEPEEGAFVQVFTTDDRQDENPDWKRVFSGWLFLNSPSLNVMEHPIYDVWIKDCAMTFPGEEEAAASASNASGSGT